MDADKLFADLATSLYVAYRTDSKPTNHDEDFDRALKDADEFVQRWQARKAKK